MNNRIPESFFIYQELISKLAIQRAQLKQQYEFKIDQLSNEMKNLVKTIEEQNKILEESKTYIKVLEQKLVKYKKAN